YKYPLAAYPYADLVETSRRRTRKDPEYELLDTGVFDGDRYFDVFVEYAKGDPEDILVRITVANRGPETAELHVLPTLWFRNDWAPGTVGGPGRPSLRQIEGRAGTSAVAARHSALGDYTLYCDGDAPLLFVENETNNDRLFPGRPNLSRYPKDGIDSYVVHGRRDAVNPDRLGTKGAAHYRLKAEPGGSATGRLRLPYP